MIKTVLIFVLIGLVVTAAAFFRVLTAPSFNSVGEINECVGCMGCYAEAEDGTEVHKQRKGCRYNPEYWRGYEYIGPSRKELKRIAKAEDKTGRWLY